MTLKKIAGNQSLLVTVVIATMAAVIGTIVCVIYAGNAVLATKADLLDHPYRRVAYLACMVIPAAIAVTALATWLFNELRKYASSVKE